MSICHEITLLYFTANKWGYFGDVSVIENEVLCTAYGSDVRLNLRKGNITTLDNTDSIVNFVYDNDVYGRMGILEAAGDVVIHEYDTKRHQPDIPYVAYGVVMTDPGGLSRYKAIFNVKVFAEMAKFKSAIHRTLRLAEIKGMRSIAFPALDCSMYKTYADAYLEMFYEYENRVRPRCLHMIDIISLQDRDHDYHGEKMKMMGEKLNL